MELRRDLPGRRDNMRKGRRKNVFWEGLDILHDESSVSQSLSCRTLVLDDVDVVTRQKHLGRAVLYIPTWNSSFTLLRYILWKVLEEGIDFIFLIQSYSHLLDKPIFSWWDCILWKANRRNAEMELRIFLCWDRHVIIFLIILYCLS